MRWQAVTVAGTLRKTLPGQPAEARNEMMGRAYAGTLGPLAFTLVIARGLLTGAGVEGTCLAACAAMFLFAAAGYVIGQGADLLVNESVRKQFQTAMADWDAKQQSAKPQNKTATK